MTGVDFGGDSFVDEPACDQAADYCCEAATELDLPFTRRRIQPPPGTEENT